MVIKGPKQGKMVRWQRCAQSLHSTTKGPETKLGRQEVAYKDTMPENLPRGRIKKEENIKFQFTGGRRRILHPDGSTGKEKKFKKTGKGKSET